MNAAPARTAPRRPKAERLLVVSVRRKRIAMGSPGGQAAGCDPHGDARPAVFTAFTR